MDLIFRPCSILDSDDFVWDSKIFFEQLNKIREEFNSYRKLNQIKILLSGLPATGKTVTGQKLSEFFNLPLLQMDQVINFYIQHGLADFDKYKSL